MCFIWILCVFILRTSDPTLVLSLPRLVLVPKVVKMEWTTVKAVNRRPGRPGTVARWLPGDGAMG